MYPSSSSVRTLRRQGGGEMPTRLASSTFVIRPSAWISLRIFRSISSRFFDTRSGFRELRVTSGIGGPDSAAPTGNSLSAARPRRAILFRVRCAIFLTHGKFCRFELQFLHSSPDTLDLHLTLSASLRRLL